MHGFVATLQSPGEIAELILRLEALGADPQDPSREDPGVRQLVERGGLDPASSASIQKAIVALGKRAELLSARQRLPVQVAPGDLAGLGAALVSSMEVARLGCPDDADLAEEARAAAEDTLDVVRRNAPPRAPAEERWWAEVERSVRQRLVPAYVKVGARLNRVEDHPLTGALLRSRAALAALCAIPGLLTFALPISTPLVCLSLALVGAYVVHPFYLRQVAAPLLDLRDTLAAEGARIQRESEDAPWPDAVFTLEGSLRDLLPVLEGERLAGRLDEAELRATIVAWGERAAERLEAQGGDARAFARVRGVLEGRLARGFARYAAARARLEGGLVSRVFDAPRLSAAVLAFVTLPLSLLAALITPFPAGVDLPLMVALFAALGWWLPTVLPGTEPALAALVAELVSHQPDLDAAL